MTKIKKEFVMGNYKVLHTDHGTFFAYIRDEIDECPVCEGLKGDGYYMKGDGWTCLSIKKNDEKPDEYIIEASGDSEIEIPCKYCPNCGKRLEETK